MRRPAHEQRWLILTTLGLVAFGLVMVFSATSARAAMGEGDPVRYLVKQSIYALVGLVLLGVASRFDYHRLRPLAPPLLVAAFAACVAVLVLGPAINGSRRWFQFGGVSVQPSEIAKIAVCVWVCAVLSRRRPAERLRDLMRQVGWVVAAFGALIILEPDLGTTITLGVMVAGILFVSGIPLRLFATVGALALAAGAVAISAAPYRRARFLGFLNPWADPEGSGFQIVQAIISIGSGGIMGRGLGQGIQKIDFLPEAHTDMILAVIGEELGLIGILVVVAGFGAFAWLGYRIAMATEDRFGRLLATGITTLVVGQAAINIAAVLALAPLTGIPLPFVSYGGSSLVVLLGSVGILLNIAVHGHVAEEARVSGGGRGDGGARAPGTRGRGGPPRPRGDGDVRGNTRPRRVASGS